MAPEDDNPYEDTSTEEESDSELKEINEDVKKEEEEAEDTVLDDNEEIIESNVTIEACLDENSSNFYEYTPFQDCNGDVIAAAYLENPGLVNFVDCGCPDCDLELSISFSSPSTFGGTDGFVIAGAIGQDKDPESDTFGDDIVTGTANYTYVIEPVNAEDAGKGAGVAIGSGAVNKSKFTFGFGINLEQTGAVGNPTYATSVVKGYVPVVSATMGASTKGLEAGTYNVYVWDANSTANCLARKQITLTNPPRIAGCTDNNTGTNDGAALNYSANAGIDNKSCIYCRASDGKLVDHQSKEYLGTGDILENFNIQIQSATDSDNTDGVIQFSATPTSLFKTYIEDTVDTNGNVDAVYKLELYTLTEAQFLSKTLGSKLGSTVSNTDAGSKFNYTFNSINGYNVTYGRYAVKVFIDDPGDGEIDGCFQLRFLTVPVLVGQDTSQPNTYVTADSITITEKALVEVTPQLAKFAALPPCCDFPALNLIQPSVVGTVSQCDWALQVTNACNNAQQKADIYYVDFQLQYDDPSLGWIDVPEPVSGCNCDFYDPNTLTADASGNALPGYQNVGGLNLSDCCQFRSGQRGSAHSGGTDPLSWPGQLLVHTTWIALQTPPTGDGDYRVKQSVFPHPTKGATPCISYSSTESVIADICGCTDTTATNYNPLANVDDGTCLTSSTPSSPDCSITTQQPDDVIATVTNATGTCTSPNSDGTASLRAYMPTTAAGCMQIAYIYPGEAAPGHVSTNVYAGGTVANPGTPNNHITCPPTPWVPGMDYVFEDLTGLAPGVYTVKTLTAGTLPYVGPGVPAPPPFAAASATVPNGYYYCVKEWQFTVGIDAAGTGCTDPGASNYNPSATCDDGSCVLAGCTDPNANNYNASATSDDGSCLYDPVSGSTNCIPPYINDFTDKIKTCIAEQGYNFYYELISGRADDCSIMNAWKLILIDYLINPVGLECVYNCADSATINVNAILTCEDKLIAGGPSTGLNDVTHSGSSYSAGAGTAVIQPATFFSGVNTFHENDVITHTDGTIWIANGPGIQFVGAQFSGHGTDPYTASGNKAEIWMQCVESMNQISFSDTTNYLDIFSSFVNKFCAHCGTENYCQTARGVARPFEGKDRAQTGIDTKDSGTEGYSNYLED